MQFNWQDWFIGGASVAIGLLFWYWALVDAEVGLRLKLAKLVAQSYGRGGARIFYAILGTLLVCLGAAIATGHTLNLIRRTPLRKGGDFHARAPKRARL
jgi:hypothetical protein